MPAGTPIVAGAGDQAAGAIGMGITRPGAVSATIGTSGVVFAATDRPATDPRGRLHTFCHAVPDRWHVMGVTQAAGLSLRWFRDQLAGGASYEQLTAEAAESLGLVNHVVEPGDLNEAALAMAAEIGRNSPLSLAGNKQIMRTLRAYGISLPEEVARQMVRLRESCFTSGDFVEGIRAFAEKRPPRWKGR